MVEQIANIAVPIAEALIDMDCVGGLFTPDDMGFRTGP
jgi:hypothetical protein